MPADTPPAAAGPTGAAAGGDGDGTRLDLGVPQRIHIVGIGGAGMSAIALVLRAMGHHVSGSDLKDSPVAERLRSHGITVAVGHSLANVAGADAVTYSPAVRPENPELAEARASGIRVVPHGLQHECDGAHAGPADADDVNASGHAESEGRPGGACPRGGRP